MMESERSKVCVIAANGTATTRALDQIKLSGKPSGFLSIITLVASVLTGC
jgi:hypothetical protein